MRVGGVNKWLVLLAKFYEMKLGRFSDHNLCVSQAMQVDLINKFHLTGGSKTPHVLYDKATNKFN